MNLSLKKAKLSRTLLLMSSHLYRLEKTITMG